MKPVHRSFPLPALAAALATVVALAPALAPAGAHGGELRATVTNVKPEQGKLMVALFDSAEAFAAGRRFAAQVVHPAAATATVWFGNLPAGRYAVAVYQDLNRNEALDTNLFGVPGEPYGFSRDAVGRMGPPPFDAMAVAIGDSPAVTAVSLTP